MAKFIGEVKLTAKKGYIELMRADAVEGGVTYSADDAQQVLKDAVSHAKRLKLKIKAFIPQVEPTSVEGKVTLFSPETIAKLTNRVPVVMKARKMPLPYMAMLLPQGPASVARKAEGLGTPKGKPAPKEPEVPQGL